MATRTASPALAGATPLQLHAGLNTKVITYNSGTDTLDASATPILLAKIPHGARIIDVTEYHTSGADTLAVDIGIGTSVSAFITAGATATLNRATKGVIDYVVSVSADAAVKYQYLLATATLGTATTSVKISCAVTYVSDGQ